MQWRLQKIDTENMEKQTEEKINADKMYAEFIKKREECKKKVDESRSAMETVFDSGFNACLDEIEGKV